MANCQIAPEQVGSNRRMMYEFAMDTQDIRNAAQKTEQFSAGQKSLGTKSRCLGTEPE